MSMALSRRTLLQFALAPAFLPRPQLQDLAPAASKVYPGGDGKLVYVADEQGNTITDWYRHWPSGWRRCGRGGGGNEGTLVMIGGASGATTKDDTKQGRRSGSFFPGRLL
jgi:hypothetical protein